MKKVIILSVLGALCLLMLAVTKGIAAGIFMVAGAFFVCRAIRYAKD